MRTDFEMLTGIFKVDKVQNPTKPYKIRFTI